MTSQVLALSELLLEVVDLLDPSAVIMFGINLWLPEYHTKFQGSNLKLNYTGSV